MWKDERGSLAPMVVMTLPIFIFLLTVTADLFHVQSARQVLIGVADSAAAAVTRKADVKVHKTETCDTYSDGSVQCTSTVDHLEVVMPDATTAETLMRDYVNRNTRNIEGITGIAPTGQYVTLSIDNLSLISPTVSYPVTASPGNAYRVEITANVSTWILGGMAKVLFGKDAGTVRVRVETYSTPLVKIDPARLQ